MPTGRFTGNDGAASVNGNSYAIKEWSAEETAKTAEGSAAGDIGTHRTFLRTDWKASAKFIFRDCWIHQQRPRGINLKILWLASMVLPAGR